MSDLQRENTVDNADINTGWQVGGNETFATVGSPDPNAAFVMPYNRYARDYLWNISKSIAEFIAPTASDDQNNMPGQYLARNWSLAAALTGNSAVNQCTERFRCKSELQR